MLRAVGIIFLFFVFFSRKSSCPYSKYTFIASIGGGDAAHEYKGELRVGFVNGVLLLRRVLVKFRPGAND